MSEISIERVGQPDLTFEGELIGQSNGSNPQLRIFRTKAGKFVAALRKDSQRSEAKAFDKPADLVQWLRGFMNSTITQEAQLAIEKAREADKDFKVFWTERIE